MKISIDLLPQQRKQEIKRKKIFHKILRGEFLFLLPIFIFICILLSTYYILILQRNSSGNTYLSQQSQDEYQKLDTYEKKFKEINDKDNLLAKIKSGHIYWKNVLIEISNIVPDSIYLNNISNKDYAVFLAGKARSRDDLIKFKDNLEGSQCFQNINVPLSNLVVKNDIDFQIDLMLKEECLKQKQ
ncbi:MAG TPA: PilN domain-containing protein [Candidatus Moranbacteria bacterium]|jgi:Tfp pilus assembly protein PilN|nr:PilN domain-containing protein [Candidatus Moranbacteria bacterium]HRY27511.1 PilN domain-containing protein [Candidatus Moranbacteria bacterium]HSA07952.1 PilN domain-containing protein [Candidatus Moranbacteria bacterium]